ncbi:molybdenum cofactor biosynthesis protein [archaeon SCG-AAA382B04]|nr:molybdenum cofactor biosynthesis protein [archaeon SCG-AAA382B04]
MTHKHSEKGNYEIKVVTVSDTRTIEEDESGDSIEDIFKKDDHEITRTIVKDKKQQIRKEIDHNYDLIIFCGGTGVSKRDVTIEAVKPLLDKELPGFAQYFRKKSFEEVGTRAIMTRTTAGILDTTYIFAIPGSVNAAKTAANIIKKEINHLVYHGK